jgi:tetratricopeptide (TPR) repeat protein
MGVSRIIAIRFLRLSSAWAVMAIALCPVVAGCSPGVPEYMIARADDVAASILVVDAQGHPIEGAQVWRVVVPEPLQICCPRQPTDQSISLAYLDRVAARYGRVAEFAQSWRPGFLTATEDLDPAIGYLVPSDSQGMTGEIIKFELGRPVSVTVKYLALAYGYTPASAQAVLKKDKNPSLRIVLTRDSSIELPAAPYWKKYLEVRRRFSGEYEEQDTEAARTELVAAAESAEAAGDVRMAARIYAWIPYLPTSIAIHESSDEVRVSGYEREDEMSPRNIALLRKAIALDPQSRYLRMKLALLDPHADRSQQIRQLDALANGGRDDLWPQVFLRLEDAYYAAGEKDKALHEFQWFKQWEPDARENQAEMYRKRRVRYLSLGEFRKDYVSGGNVRVSSIADDPIYYATQAGRVDLFDWLLANGAKRPLDYMVVVQSVQSKRPEMVRRMLELVGEIPGMEDMDLQREIDAVDEMLKVDDGDHANLEEIRNMLVARHRPAALAQ